MHGRSTRPQVARQATGHGVGSTTRAASSGAGMSTRDVDRTTDMFGDVEPAQRLQMELVVRRSASPEAALPLVIDLLVPGSPAKRAAIVSAFTENEPLREQWARTWEVLRR
jgi:hypothetical protein